LSSKDEARYQPNINGYERDSSIKKTSPPEVNETPEDRKKRFLEASEALRRAFALSVPHEDALAIRDEFRYMLARANLLKVGPSGGKPTEYDMDTAIAQLATGKSGWPFAVSVP
jgi:hypothetical protein